MVIIRCWGDYACFTQPEFKAERYTYDVITPSAARGILESIYWVPGITWVVEKIWTTKPLKRLDLRRNETQRGISTKTFIDNAKKNEPAPTYNAQNDRTLRYTHMLKDVEFYIQAHAEVNNSLYAWSAKKAEYSLKQHARQGSVFQQPYLGCREFLADYEVCDSPPTKSEYDGDQDLDTMFWGWEFNTEDESPMALYYQATVENGCITIPRREELL